MIESRSYSFKSIDEAVQFFAQQAEDRHGELLNQLMAVEIAMQAVLRASPEATNAVLTVAEDFEQSEAEADLRKRLLTIASQLRRFVLVDTEEAQERVKLSVVEGGLSTKE